MQAPEVDQVGYNAEVSSVLKRREILFKEELEGEYVGKGYVYLKEMSEADVAARTKMVLEQKRAKRRGDDEDVQINAEKIRQHDFVKSIEDWEGFMRPVRDDNGEIDYEVEPEYVLDAAGNIKTSRRSGLPMMISAGVPKLEEMDPIPSNFRTLSQYVGDQIAAEIRDINQLPESPDELDPDTGRKKGSLASKARGGVAETDEDRLRREVEEMTDPSEREKVEEKNPTT